MYIGVVLNSFLRSFKNKIACASVPEIRRTKRRSRKEQTGQDITMGNSCGLLANPLGAAMATKG
jgi:hypothetical protein